MCFMIGGEASLQPTIWSTFRCKSTKNSNVDIVDMLRKEIKLEVPKANCKDETLLGTWRHNILSLAHSHSLDERKLNEAVNE